MILRHHLSLVMMIRWKSLKKKSQVVIEGTYCFDPKQQEEEAEREAEAMRRKEERNKRKLRTEKLKHLKETHQDADVPSKIATWHW